ncbi:MAG: hypothetical protein QOC76_5066, partial [Mycobacterium sp.]|nr:hypothetical protein [Mycobacterium sp.]
ELLVRGCENGTLGWQRLEPSLWRGNRHVSDQRYDAPDTAVVAPPAAAVVARSPRVGYVPARANTVRDAVAVALLVIALLLPWNAAIIATTLLYGTAAMIALVIA